MLNACIKLPMKAPVHRGQACTAYEQFLPKNSLEPFRAL